MHCVLRRLIVVGASLVATTFLFCGSIVAQTVWSGLTKTFSQAAFTDATLPENQDMLTPDVKFTRGSSGGLINIAAESSFNQSLSPSLTEWATDLNNASQTIVATNWQNLTFTDWLDAYGGPGSHGAFIAGRNAVLHLIPDNVYLDLRFTSWASGTGGAYAYSRAEPAALAPTGDYNGNRVVDAADYVVWKHTFGRNGIEPGSGADGNSSGSIDAGDYTYWRERFGNILGESGFGAATVVPEPNTVVFAIVGFGLMIVRGFNARVQRRRVRSVCES